MNAKRPFWGRFVGVLAAVGVLVAIAGLSGDEMLPIGQEDVRTHAFYGGNPPPPPPPCNETYDCGQ